MKGWIRQHAIAVAGGLVAVVALLVGGLIVQAVMLHADGWRLQLGNLAEWFGALGALATVAALVVAWKVYQADKAARVQEDGRRADADKRAQAELVAAWANSFDPSRRAQVGLRNGSSAAMYELYIEVSCTPAPDSEGIVPPASKFSVDLLRARGRVAVLPPSEKSFHSEVELADGVRPESVSITFKDSRGLWWHRSGSGNLETSSRPTWADQGIWVVQRMDLGQIHR